MVLLNCRYDAWNNATQKLWKNITRHYKKNNKNFYIFLFSIQEGFTIVCHLLFKSMIFAGLNKKLKFFNFIFNLQNILSIKNRWRFPFESAMHLRNEKLNSFNLSIFNQYINIFTRLQLLQDFLSLHKYY